MPYASKAQQKFFHSAGAAKAGITPAEVAEFDAATKAGKGFAKLPEKKSPEQMKEKRAKMKNRHK